MALQLQSPCEEWWSCFSDKVQLFDSEIVLTAVYCWAAFFRISVVWYSLQLLMRRSISTFRSMQSFEFIQILLWEPRFSFSVMSLIDFLFLSGGYFAGSLAVLTDAAHLLTDFASFMISLFSLWLGARPATKRMSFGWYRAGAFFKKYAVVPFSCCVIIWNQRRSVAPLIPVYVCRKPKVSLLACD